MLEDAAVPVLLTEQHLVAGLPSHQAKIICIDNEWGVTTAVHDIAPEVNASPDDLAYVIYTSGSTGRPKGVEIAQRGLCNMIDWQTRAFQVNEKSRVLQFASFSFDASVSEVFMALTKGATLVLKSRKAGMSSIELAAFLRRNGITHATFPPSLLAVLSAERCV